jgi:hypothetical protein
VLEAMLKNLGVEFQKVETLDATAKKYLFFMWFMVGGGIGVVLIILDVLFLRLRTQNLPAFAHLEYSMLVAIPFVLSCVALKRIPSINAGLMWMGFAVGGWQVLQGLI